jgi:ribosome maturation factor RimP
MRGSEGLRGGSARPGKPPSRNPEEVTAAVAPIAERVAESRGLVLWGVSLDRHAGRDLLSVAVDKLGGVGSDELAAMSQELSRELDRTDAVGGDDRYTLEVTSPGAERELHSAEQFEICAGRQVRLQTTDGRSIEGEIEPGGPGEVVVGTKEGSIRVPHADIARARLIVKEFGS